MTLSETCYIVKRILIAIIQSIPFYLFRIIPIKKNKIVFTTIEGTSGFSCNPKYIAVELMRRNRKLPIDEQFELVWLVNDTSKLIPKGIRKVKNKLLYRAYELTTAGFWIDNSRKQLEVRKRRGQIYIQTWHAKLGFKPTCLDRGASFSRIAYLVSKHDSDMVDYWLSNSDWYDKTLKNGALYEGKVLRSGSPRCDILLRGRNKARNRIREKYGLHKDRKIILYCPTFRGGNQTTEREIEAGNHMPDLEGVLDALRRRFSGDWIMLLRLHPQLTVRGTRICILNQNIQNGQIQDVSREDDMYEILAACDAFLTDYSSAAFDAAVMRIPVFLYCDDLEKYEEERGKLLWDLKSLPFPYSLDSENLAKCIELYDEELYISQVNDFFLSTKTLESGYASERVVDFVEKMRAYMMR